MALKNRPKPKAAPKKRVPQALKKIVKGDDDNGKAQEAKKSRDREKPEPAQAEPATGRGLEEAVATGGSGRPAGRPEPAPRRAEEEITYAAGQLTADELRRLEYPERLKLWKELNKGSKQEDFVTIRKPDDLPKMRYMRKDEAEQRGAVAPKPKDKHALWCPYCMDWMPFMTHSWTGYTKCCGCSMSTRDFHIAGDNGLTE